jgi:outer membrane protein OmpA-like peptidoglycan-associated protein
MNLACILIRVSAACKTIAPPRHAVWLALGGAAALSACSMPDLNPVDLFHTAEGGKIAEERPAPPQSNLPYPNLSVVPKAPPPPDTNARNAITSGLVGDRANAQYAATLNPLPAQPVQPAKPQLPAQKPMADDEGSSASLTAATAPPPPPGRVGPLGPPQPPLPNTPMTAPRSAPAAKVQTADLAPPTAPPPPAAVNTTASPVRGSVDAPVGEGRPAAPLASLPSVPDAPPPPAALPGVSGITVPTPPPAAPPPPPPPPRVITADGAPLLLGFPPGSSTLPVDTFAPLKILSRQRGDRTIVITGYGEATGSDAKAQAAALPLALARARAIATNLLAAGVPSGAIRINAEAQGQGAAAKLVN